MLSDESSTDSESGRFKSHSKSERKDSNKDISRPSRGARLLPDLARSRNTERSGKGFNRQHEDRGRFGGRRSRDRYDSLRRHSPPRRRYSRDRSPVVRKSSDRPRPSREREHSRGREAKQFKDWKDVKDTKRSDDRDRKKSHDRTVIRSVSPKKTQDSNKRNFREEIRKNIIANISKEKSQEPDRPKEDKNPRDRRSEYSESHRRDVSSEIFKSGREISSKFEVHPPTERIDITIKNRSPTNEKSIRIEQDVVKSLTKKCSKGETSDVEQLTSYYNPVPVKADVTVDVDTIHSVDDSSEDEEKLRAKLLNLEKELHKSKKKKSKKSKKKSKSKQKDKGDSVEVSSTTDIQGSMLDEKSASESQMQAAEVSSTQHRGKKDSSEEGEISTEDDNANVSIDPLDLRHRLKRSTTVPDTSGSPDLREKLKLKTEVAGPALPPLAEKRTQRSPSPEVEGPELPPHLRRERNIGPALPNDMRKTLAEASHDRTVIRYASSDEEGIGPLPPGAEDKWTEAHKKLEERALDMKIRNLEGGSSRSDVKTREEWMLELPEAKAKHLGLGPRQFRNKEAPDMSDRSSWTDTPGQKELKAAGLAPVEEASSAVLQRDAHQRYVADRDHDQEKAVKKHKKKHKRDESLLDMHQKKLKKKKKKEEKEEGGSVRRPFDRDVDLQANRFDDAQKKAIIKKAQHLDSRFSRGDAKYL